MSSAEHRRLQEAGRGDANWSRWGPYLAERAWGTVREDYSPEGHAWQWFPHDHARSRVYRWNEDGLSGFSDDHQYLCMGLALWNERDPILKERLFGLTNEEGNHGEDVKEAYWFLDATPTHSYLRMRYRYPQLEFPYDELIGINAGLTRSDPEYELIDTGVFDGNRFFDVDVEYAKAAPEDIVMRITVHNRGDDEAVVHVLPTLWFRNTWSWGYEHGPMLDVETPPRFTAAGGAGDSHLVADHPVLGRRLWYTDMPGELLFTENETNAVRHHGAESSSFSKDAFHRRVVDAEEGAVNPDRTGTKAAVWHRLQVAASASVTVTVRLTPEPLSSPFADTDDIVAARRSEADEFYDVLQPSGVGEELRRIHREAMAGLIWSKQLYYYDVAQWLEGDPAGPSPAPQRRLGRNASWKHLNNFDVLSMPDTWEYPWYASWDLAFHCLPLAQLDPRFAKGNLQVLTREWYMHPSGQVPAYEWGFDMVNPPVLAWATRRVAALDAARTGEPDDEFLEAMFHKLLLNFTWWVNRKDTDGNNVFQGGFLGLDNISLFDRSETLPTGGHVDQSDGTAWMAFYTLGMLRIALELAHRRPVYQAVATKFYEHFLAISHALTLPEHSLWDEDDGFFYDVLHLPDGSVQPLRVRSLVGLLPLVGVEVIEREVLDAVPAFTERMEWFSRHRPELSQSVASVARPGAGERHLLSVLDEPQLRSVLGYLLDPDEFLSPHGIRSLSKVHASHPFGFEAGGREFTIEYEPAESRTGAFGGNSNWRGPVWFPLNHLIIEALREYHSYYGDGFMVEFPTGSGSETTLAEVADDLSRRLISLFEAGDDGIRPGHGRAAYQREHSLWRDTLDFHEYFDGDTGAGLGASHQTGWTALVATLIDELASRR